MAKQWKIAIDGPASSGKSTIARELSDRLKITYLDTGAMYRAVTWQLLAEGVPLTSTPVLKQALENLSLTLESTAKGQRIAVNGLDVTDKIRQQAVTEKVSQVASLKEVRTYLVHLQQAFARKDQGIVMDGRDIGTVVMPHADLKIYLSASAKERARRRYEEDLEKGRQPSSYEEVLAALKARDHFDQTRKESPLKQAEDAFLIDSTGLTIPEVVQDIIDLLPKEK